MTAAWSRAERSAALARAENEGVELLVVGGGITGAGVLRDAASRGMHALLVERDDFASGTSSRSSKLIHGGFRYLAEGQLRVTREACRERDLLLQLAPHLIRPMPFPVPAFEGSKVPMWQVRAGLLAYSALANFRRTARTKIVNAEEVLAYAPGLRAEGLRGGGLYTDAQTDDARLVVESLKSARYLGGEAVNHAEVVELVRHGDGRMAGARVLDLESGQVRTIRAEFAVNATGVSVDRVHELGGVDGGGGIRPAKGIHLAIPRDRLQIDGAVVFEAHDRRHVFVVPWEDVLLIGTTDEFSDEVDEPAVQIEEVHYLLTAANAAFPRAALTTNDLRSVFAGVRPLAASADDESPSTSVSREDRIENDGRGLLSVSGGKLTTYRAMGERIVDLVVAGLPSERRRALQPSRTAVLPLREQAIDADALAGELIERHAVDASRAQRLVRAYGSDALPLLDQAAPADREPIGDSQFLFAEIAWSWRTECPLNLCDLLERRLRVALLVEGQGLRQLERIGCLAAAAAGWSAKRVERELDDYVAVVRRRYQISPPREVRRSEASGSAALPQLARVAHG
jgi:glycerol-3-phosphate dehydrogenase